LGINNDTVKQRRSKAMDISFYWIKDRVAQDQYVVHWRKGSDNLADYFTKHHSFLTIASCARGIWLTYTNQLLCKGVLNLPRNHFRVTRRSRPQTSRIA
jgi:hypothetical protein